jgi:hypothetical protein
VTWGDYDSAGDSSAVQAQLQGDVQQVFGTLWAITPLKGDGSLVTWGHPDKGGDSSAVQAQLQGDVQQVFEPDGAFAALTGDGVACDLGPSRLRR